MHAIALNGTSATSTSAIKRLLAAAGCCPVPPRLQGAPNSLRSALTGRPEEQPMQSFHSRSPLALQQRGSPQCRAQATGSGGGAGCNADVPGAPAGNRPRHRAAPELPAYRHDKGAMHPFSMYMLGVHSCLPDARQPARITFAYKGLGPASVAHNTPGATFRRGRCLLLPRLPPGAERPFNGSSHCRGCGGVCGDCVCLPLVIRGMSHAFVVEEGSRNPPALRW